MNTVFKAIKVDIKEKVSNKDVNLIKNIFNFFPTDEFAYDLLSEKAVIYLNKFDY